MNPNKALWEKGDFTRIAASMRESGEALVKTLGVTNGLSVLDVGCGDGTTALPIDTESVDVVISNGVLNLVPEKRAAVVEIRRVLKPGGRVQIADIVLGVELPEDARQDIDLWTG